MDDYIVEDVTVTLTKDEYALIYNALMTYADEGCIYIDHPIFDKFNMNLEENTRGFLQGKEDDDTHGTFTLTTKQP
jgi:hypothetical protein